MKLLILLGFILSHNCLAQMKETVYKALMSYETPKAIRKKLEQKAYSLAGNKRNAVIATSAFSILTKPQLKFNVSFKGNKSQWLVSNNSISANMVWEF